MNHHVMLFIFGYFTSVVHLGTLAPPSNNSPGKKQSSLPPCISLPSQAEDWGVMLFDNNLKSLHAVPAKPICQKPSDIARLQKPAIISVFSPDFSQFSKQGYRIDKLKIKTKCQKGFMGGIEKSVMSSVRRLVDQNDYKDFQKTCSNDSCGSFLSKMYIGDSKLYPSPESYDCSWWSVREKEVDRVLITAITIQFNSEGLLTHPALGVACNVFNQTICAQISNNYLIIFPTQKLDPCAVSLKIIAPGVISWNQNNIEVDSKTHIVLPEQKMHFWFEGDYYSHKVKCKKNSLEIRESSDGYLIGISSGTKDNMNAKVDPLNLQDPNFLKTTLAGTLPRYNKIRQKRDTFNITTHGNYSYDSLQRSYSRAELQYGLMQLKQRVDLLAADLTYELCKFRSQMWGHAYTHLLSNPDLMASWIYPLEHVKGIFRDNVLEVIYGKTLMNFCIPTQPSFDGLFLKVMHRGQSLWLHSSTGELITTPPDSSKKYKIASFVVPVVPSGYYDIIDKRFMEDSYMFLRNTASNSSLLFSEGEFYSIQEVLTWNSDYQKYESRVLGELSEDTTSYIDLPTTFDAMVVIPLTQVWKGFSSSVRSTTCWIIFGLSIITLLYMISNIMIPLMKLRTKKRLKEESNLLKAQANLIKTSFTPF